MDRLPGMEDKGVGDLDERVERLRTIVEFGRVRFKGNKARLLSYVNEIVVPILQQVLNDLSLNIDRRHRLENRLDGETCTVIHYTSIQTLMCMLQDASMGRYATLRLYDSIHFNDPDEGKYLGKSLPEEHNWAANSSLSHAYVASFIDPSSEPHCSRNLNDDLVYWRTYGREAGGCSLEVEVPSNSLRRVFYGPRNAEDAIGDLQPILQILEPLQAVNRKIRQSLVSAFWESLGRIQYLYKSEDYKFEKECRFVVCQSDIDEKRIHFDFSGGTDFSAQVRHFCQHEDLSIERIFISGSSVTLGPRVSHPDDLQRILELLRQRIVERLKRVHAAEGFYFQVKPSKVSYR